MSSLALPFSAWNGACMPARGRGFEPVPRMVYDTGADHVEVDVGEAAGQMLVGVDRGGVVAVFPEGP
jgi:hypothetical protein